MSRVCPTLIYSVWYKQGAMVIDTKSALLYGGEEGTHGVAHHKINGTVVLVWATHQIDIWNT